ncbi:MAG: HAD family hydrolase [Chromatiales bacterium 21-64-14]|nr:MAG: HAD family hydrolase [Chromatiales bacterium 21-64-14]HQU16109.1 HAD-IIB family hydrolase [Gammaproteobacteria bacterium]
MGKRLEKGPPRDLYLLLVSVHGLIRGHDLELGRDADTGGQVKYVVELARALAAHPEVGRVDLLTRQVFDPKISSDYAQPEEQIAPNAYIIRLPFGPRRYLRKEVLWPYLEGMVDLAVQYVRRVGRLPDLIHSHYADAGYVGAPVASLLGVPLIHTGHSLGRVKRLRLLEKGTKDAVMEAQYNIAQRIEAEEIALDTASRVIASTHQEVEEQYSLYDNYQPGRMVVIPPGVDLGRFHPPQRGVPPAAVQKDLERFLRDPRRPMILAVSRADERKNIATLVRAYGGNAALRERANLVVVAGNRDDIATLERGARDVMTGLLLQIDRHDLYGSVAYPKHHAPDDIPALYRMAATTRGVFVNPALTEPFGLTLLEAAASGLPVVSTEDGGPRDIVGICKNGLLVDPLDVDGMGASILEALSDRERWQRWSRSGIRGAQEHYSWKSHVQKYLREVRSILGERYRSRTLAPEKSRLPTVDRLVVCDIDDTLMGDAEAARAFIARLEAANGQIGFGVATGRSLDSTLEVLKECQMPVPDLLITAVGTAIHYGHGMVDDAGWRRHIDYRWEPDLLRTALADLPGLRIQPRREQQPYKISYYVDPEESLPIRGIQRHLRKRDLHVNLIYSHQMFLDLVPIRASKGLALRYLAWKWGLPLERVLVAGNSGNDREMLLGNTLGVVVSNHSAELNRLRGKPRVYFSKGAHAWGILEAMDYYDFLGEIRIQEEEVVES